MPTDKQGIRTWDLLIRLFHWTLVAAFFTAYLTEDDWMSLHVLAGEQMKSVKRAWRVPIRPQMMRNSTSPSTV